MEKIIWDEDKIQKLWNNYAGGKETYFAYHSGKALLRFLLRNRVNFCNKKVLDFGCGNGYMWQWMKDLGLSAEYVGAEFSEESIVNLKNNFGNEIEVVAVKNFPLPYEEETFDIILVTEVIEHLSDDILQKDIREWRRLLKKEGLLIITTPNNENLEKNMIYCPNCDCKFHRWQHIRSWNMDSIDKYFQKQGMKKFFCGITYLYSIQKSWIYNYYIKVKRTLRLLCNKKLDYPELIYICKKI